MATKKTPKKKLASKPTATSRGAKKLSPPLALAPKHAVRGKMSLKVAKYGAPGRPLRIDGIELPCYVLENETRVITRSGIQAGIGMSPGGSSTSSSRLVSLMNFIHSKGVDTKGLISRLESPIKFTPPHGGSPAYGFEATILPDICAVVMEAARLQKLKKSHSKLSRTCSILQHAFSTVGIIALVDEATGFQEFRSRDALAEILEKFVQKELRPWVKTFPPEFYEQVYRLNGWTYSSGCQHPGVLGHWTNNIVYRRLAPGVLDELRKMTPRSPSGRLKNKLFQHLTEDTGHPKLREHLVGVLMLMKYSRDWRVFMKRLDTECPQFGKNYMLPFPDDYDGPD